MPDCQAQLLRKIGARALVCLLALGPAVLGAVEEPHAFLQKHVGFSKSDLSALERGEPVAKVLDAKEPTEIEAFGAIGVNVPMELFVEKIRGIADFKKSKEVLQIGKFHNPPCLEDLEALTLDPDEILLLKNCIVGSCKMKATAEMIERLREEVLWSMPTWAQKATEVYRGILLSYVQDYLAKGNAALAVYVDKERPVRLADEFRALLGDSPYLAEYVPEFRSYLDNFPNGRLAGVEDFIYWSKEKFGARPVVSITHVTIYKKDSGDRSSAVISSKQIYANHYFRSSLGLTAFATRPGSGGTAGYLMYLNRSRVDLLGGFLTFIKRWFIKKRLREGLEGNLRVVKRKLETGSGS